MINGFVICSRYSARRRFGRWGRETLQTKNGAATLRANLTSPSKLISCENVIVVLGVIMVVCLPLTIVTGVVALIFMWATIWERKRYNGRRFCLRVLCGLFSLHLFSGWPKNV